MPENTQVDPDSALIAEIDAIGQDAEPNECGGPAPLEVTPIPTIPLSALIRNPANPRSTTRRKPDADLVASVKADGFKEPFLITRTDDPGVFMVMDGHERMNVAEHLKLAEVPYAFDGSLADDPVAHHLVAVITSQHKKPLTALETASALFNAAEAGASKTRLSKAYGRKHGGVERALTVGRLPQATRSAAAACTYDWDITELAALDEFADDQEATERLMQAAEENKFAVQVERERIERTEREERDVIRAEHEAAGVNVLDEEPDDAVRVSRLRDKETGAYLTVEQHAACPGHAAVFESYGQVRVSFYCLDPDANGHEDSWSYNSRQNAPKVQDKAAKKAVVRGNKDHTAAQTVRETWLRGLISGAGSLDKDKLDKISRFTTLATLTAPDPVRKFASTMKRAELQAGLLGMGGYKSEDFEQAVTSASPRRLMLLQFAVVAAAYEKAVTKDAWRTDQAPSEYGGSDRKHARVWLEFCREVGHNLAPIEAAIVADETYTPADLSSPGGTLTGGQDAQDGADEGTQDGGDEQAGDEDAADEEDRDETSPARDDPQDQDAQDQDAARTEDGTDGPADPQVEKSGAA
ncbi:MAG TPA: ParB N-terminal domain-containing protein [Actinocrinis sp.]|nr:ParB N-terminal domain-containing protein [Actinocrinis sp.]